MISKRRLTDDEKVRACRRKRPRGFVKNSTGLRKRRTVADLELMASGWFRLGVKLRRRKSRLTRRVVEAGATRIGASAASDRAGSAGVKQRTTSARVLTLTHTSIILPEIAN